MLYTFISRILPLVAVTTLGGCVAKPPHMEGQPRKVDLQSEPSGSMATTSFGESCTTPCSVAVGSKYEFSVLFKLQDYKETSVSVVSKTTGLGVGVLALTTVLGGVGGLAGAAASGQSLFHVPNPVMVTLEREKPAGPPARGARNKRPAPKAAPAPKPVEPAEPAPEA